MKTISSRFPRSKRGMALISVLAVLLLLTLLVVAFMARTTAARASSASYHATSNTRLLADTAVNLVQAQINESTTDGMGATGLNPTDTWASQPGAIRVFQNNTSTPMLGSLAYVYRLYSATPTAPSSTNTPRLIDVSASIDPTATTTALNDLAADLPTSSNWTQYSAQWCDLNSFVSDNEGKFHFPIVDPRDPAADPTVNPTSGSIGTLWKPLGSNPPLHGFSVQPPAAVGNTVNPAPMPVRWLYVLKDGSIIAPDSPSTPSNVLTFANAGVKDSSGHAAPSVLDPIVGRIAYWTDDDSCKININTAAGDDVVRSPNNYAADSIFWATPAFCSNDEVFLARYQPDNGEIQRYPGHPGTVGLNNTLSTLLGLTNPLSYDDFYGNPSRGIQGLTPRYTGGGSQSATVSVNYTGGVDPTIPLTASRLYTSIGEMLYKVPALTDTTRAESALVSETSEDAAARAIERSNFFLTAHSSSSELNLWGEPRISIWPITTARPTYTAAQSQTPIDQLIAFDSTIARTGPAGSTTGVPNYFYFQRTDPTSSVTDCNIANNIKLFNYLDTLTSTAIPGFGLAFSAKYANTVTSTSTHQIISEIFDYVRTTNMLDPLLTSETTGGASLTYGQNWGLTTASVIQGGTSTNGAYYRSGCGDYQVVPSANNGQGVNGWHTQGLGSFPIPVEVTIHFVAEGLGYQPPVYDTTTSPQTLVRVGYPEIPVAWQQFGDPNVAHDEGAVVPLSAGYPVASSNPPYTFNVKDEIIPDQQAYPQTTTPPGTFGSVAPQTASPEFNTIALATAPTSTWNQPYCYYNPPSGRPTDWSTAMQAFVYVSFVNPAQLETHSQPMFCYSITGLNNLSVTDSNFVNTIFLHFPGYGTGFNPPYGKGLSSDEEKVVVDNSDGGGFINGWIGDWIFGYIPWDGSVGVNNYGGNPSTLGPQQTTWGISNNVSIAPSTNSLCFIAPIMGSVWPQDPSALINKTNSVSGRAFPFYSQLFCVMGEQQSDAADNPPTAQTNLCYPTPPFVNPPNYPGTVGTPLPFPTKFTANGKTFNTGNPNANGTFTFNGGAITIKMYDANHDGQTLTPLDPTVHLVSSYSLNFPSATLPLPTYSNSDLHIFGTMPCAYPSPPNPPPIERWHQGLDQASGGPFYNDIITPNDVAQSVTLSPAWSDARDLAIASNGTSNTTTFIKHPNYGASSTAALSGLANDLLCDSSEPFVGNNNPTNWGRLVTQTVGGSTSYYPATDTQPLNATWLNYPIVPPRLNGSAGLGLVGQGAYTASPSVPGDWDNGVAWYSDGPWINAPDQGALVTNEQAGGEMNSLAYFNTGNLAQKAGIVSTFSPDRMMPSPAMFGSLPTGIIPAGTTPRPWQTLLFRPGPHAGNFPSNYHPGERNRPSQGDPADELLLDLFWMPQVEPYPISQPFVTDGKINLNYEIQPFTYITRDTALRALLVGEKIAVMPDSLANNYKVPSNPLAGPQPGAITAATGGKDVNGNTRLPIDVDQTLGLNPDNTVDPHSPTSGTGTTNTAQTSQSSVINNAWYDSTAKTTRFFRSGAELCDIFLVPQGYDWEEFTGFSSLGTHSWYKIPGGDFALVGDNNRERPYADLYSRVTTKSNTYTVYYTVQTLKNAEPQINATGANPGQQAWDESKGGVTGEYRGSSILERYIDPNEVLPDYLDNPSTLESLEPYYKWRIIEQRQFAP